MTTQPSPPTPQPPQPGPQPPTVVGRWGDNTVQVNLDEAQYVHVAYFDEVVRVIADPLSMELALEEFMAVAMSIEAGPEDDPRAVGAIRIFLQTMIHPEDFRKFWAAVRRHRQNLEAQMGFGKYLVEVVTGRPTVLPSGSSGGQHSTQGNSAAGSLSRAIARLQQEGRPDLAAQVLVAQEGTTSTG